MKKKIFTGITLVVLVLAVGCATINFQLTTQNAASWMNNIYATHYDLYLTYFDVVGADEKGKPIYKIKEGVSEKQKHILREQKKILVELEPLLKIFSTYAAGGSTPALIDVITNRAITLTQGLIDTEGGL